MIQPIKTKVQEIRDDIERNYLSMRLFASYNFASQLTVEDEGSRIRITAPAYAWQMQDGRSAGSMPPVSAIRKWIQDKNANAGTSIPESAAWGIATVMKRDGITVPNKFNKGGVISDVLNPAEVDRLATDVRDILRGQILTILSK